MSAGSRGGWKSRSGMRPRRAGSPPRSSACFVALCFSSAGDGGPGTISIGSRGLFQRQASRPPASSPSSARQAREAWHRRSPPQRSCGSPRQPTRPFSTALRPSSIARRRPRPGRAGSGPGSSPTPPKGPTASASPGSTTTGRRPKTPRRMPEASTNSPCGAPLRSSPGGWCGPASGRKDSRGASTPAGLPTSATPPLSACPARRRP